MKYNFRIKVDKLNDLITESGLKRKVIAEWLGVSITTFNRWIREENPIPLNKAVALGKIIGCSVYDFLEEVDEDGS